MSDALRSCPSCGQLIVMKPNVRFCFSCGTPLAPQTEEERESSPDEWDGSEDLSSWQRRTFKPRAHIRARGTSFGERVRARAVGPMSRISPAGLFLLNIATLGVVGSFWLARRSSLLNSLDELSSPDESARVPVWFAFHMAGVAFALLCAIFGADAAAGCAAPLAAIYLGASFVMSRYCVMRLRSAIIEAFGAKIASSAMLLWYIGVPYMQLWINRALASGAIPSISTEGAQR